MAMCLDNPSASKPSNLVSPGLPSVSQYGGQTQLAMLSLSPPCRQFAGPACMFSHFPTKLPCHTTGCVCVCVCVSTQGVLVPLHSNQAQSGTCPVVLVQVDPPNKREAMGYSVCAANSTRQRTSRSALCKDNAVMYIMEPDPHHASFRLPYPMPCGLSIFAWL